LTKTSASADDVDACHSLDRDKMEILADEVSKSGGQRRESNEGGWYEAEPVENNLPRLRRLCANGDWLT
jgi:hypothetical protein